MVKVLDEDTGRSNDQTTESLYQPTLPTEAIKYSVEPLSLRFSFKEKQNDGQLHNVYWLLRTLNICLFAFFKNGGAGPHLVVFSCHSWDWPGNHMRCWGLSWDRLQARQVQALYSLWLLFSYHLPSFLMDRKIISYSSVRNLWCKDIMSLIWMIQIFSSSIILFLMSTTIHICNQRSPF